MATRVSPLGGDAQAGFLGVMRRTYVFGSPGVLFRLNKLMDDRTTCTLWNQLTGESVIGKLVGLHIVVYDST